MNAEEFGIIGCRHAHIGIFIEEMLKLGYRCAGLYDPEGGVLAETMAAKYGIKRVQEQDAVLHDRVKVIGCAAINAEKIDIVELCESLGKPVMLDKPAVVSREGQERLKRVAERGRIQLGMLLTERFQPAIWTLKRLLEQGELGELVSLGTRKPHRLDAESRPDWFFDEKQSGGILIDLLIHDFDLLRWLTGREPAAVHSWMSKTALPERPSFYNAVQAQAVLEGGVLAQLYADWQVPTGCPSWGDGRIFVAGTKGMAELRLHGDPPAGEGEPRVLLASAGGSGVWQEIETVQPPCGISEDFMRRLAGSASVVSQHDILRASELAVESAASAVRLRST
ncbi:Predicted dehydrogenase [Paenibacillus sp. UNCCL117]|uniref:Gfo/Idh/MocA family protein n=1 Tax=unclassified Paenibacillus TaxID=185978 RepID=UPI000881DE5D|nr:MULTISPECIES: Gfo/Idh/MocA family oxidoreductase [unclassified Paenibacillus]SDD69087.1 Predicted dehydrogenase [Paenibacillus sp. cl123]SFW45069.1 Predicted dehydrogenase [Paenibacillus sp. UNCCL117]